MKKKLSLQTKANDILGQIQKLAAELNKPGVDTRKIIDGLSENIERLNLFLKYFQGVVYQGNIDYSATFFHGSIEELTGYTKSELLEATITWDQIIHPGDFAGMSKEFQDVQHIRDFSSEREYRIIRKDGQIRWVREFIQNICDDSGNPAFVQGALFDITESKRIEKSLSFRVKELAALNSFGKNVNAKLILDEAVSEGLDKLVEIINPDLALLFIRKNEELLLQAVRSTLCFPQNEMKTHHVGECICGLSVQNAQPIYSRNIHTDSRCTWDECKQMGLHSFCALPLMSRGNVIGTIGLASTSVRDFEEYGQFLESLADIIAAALQNSLLYEQAKRRGAELNEINKNLAVEISKRKRSEGALRDSEEKYHNLFDSETDAIIIVDAETRDIIDFNKSASNLYGYTKEEFMRLNALELSAEPDKSKRAIKKIAKKGSGRIDIRFHKKKDGTLFPIEIAASLFTWRGRQVMCVIFRDITERIKNEKELKESNRNLIAERKALNDKNIALREILDHIKEEKENIASDIESNIGRVVMPALDRLEKISGSKSKEYVKALRNDLINITSPFINKLERNASSLSPREIEICNLIRNGNTSKEIATVLNTSPETVRGQRKKIRKKLGLIGHKINLTSYLKSSYGGTKKASKDYRIPSK